MKTKMQEKALEMRRKANRMDTLDIVYNCILNQLHWNFCSCNEVDENGENVYTEPTKPENFDEWDGIEYNYECSVYARFLVWKEALTAIEKLA